MVGTISSSNCPKGYKIVKNRETCETKVGRYLNIKTQNETTCWRSGPEGCILEKLDSVTSAVVFNDCSDKDTKFGVSFSPLCEPIEGKQYIVSALP